MEQGAVTQKGGVNVMPAELWVSVFDFITVDEIRTLAIETGSTIREVIGENVSNWSEVFDMTDGYTVETLTNALVSFALHAA